MSNIEQRESIVLTNEGQKIFGVLHLPKGIERPPCVLMCHGLGGHKTGHYRVYVELAEALIEKKIASFRFDFRGCGDSEGHFSEMTLHGEVSDALKALNFLHTDPRVNNEQIGLFGRSLGGAVAVLTAAKFNYVKTLALWAPIFDGEQWKHYWTSIQNGQISEHESIEMRRINGQVAGLPFYEELFNMRIDRELKALHDLPLLLIHGEQDTVVNIGHAEKYEKLRKEANAVTDFIRLTHADHDFTVPEERIFAIKRTANWFKEILC